MTQTALKTSLPALPGFRAPAWLRQVGRRVANAVMTLAIIAYITSLGLILADRGRQHLPAQPLDAAWHALGRTAAHFFNHPATYYWHREELPAFGLVAETLMNSAGLLLLSLLAAAILGVSLGMAAALSRRKIAAATIMLFSVLGISTPSFLLGMILWVANISVHKQFDITVLPSAGFGWDGHMVMPALVLAARPLAQIAQVTYISLSEVLRQDYIRTANSKGMPWRMVRNRHAIRNVFIPILTTLGASLRFSLASLPVVELFFDWPGVGMTLLQAIDRENPSFVIDLILSLGLFFLAVNLAIELFFPVIDPRLRNDGNNEERQERTGFLQGWSAAFEAFSGWLNSLTERLGRAFGKSPKKAALTRLPPAANQHALQSPATRRMNRARWLLGGFFSNASLLLGLAVILGLAALVFVGPSISPANPYQTNTVMMIDGEIAAPPFWPSSVFPWGSDHVGRDIQALVLHGARQTLFLAFFGMLARLVIGSLLGALAGWQRGGWFDRMVVGAVGVWAAFPVTLFAMLLIQALGIQQGMWVFVIAISLVGWGEVAQFVRGQVISIKPQPYIEAARSVGSGVAQILRRHVTPNLVNSLLVLASLEMGGVLMLLAELGYLNIFMGGGFAAEIGEVGRMVAVVARFSDVPEWAALIANVREWWRSYPWMAFYPGMAFFVSILAFNLFGEGLRRFLEDIQANLSRLFNRRTFAFMGAVALGIGWLLRTNTPLDLYRPEALRFDEQRALQDIYGLASPYFQGRETGTRGATLAADYIAMRMEEIGLLPAGGNGVYIQQLTMPRLHLRQEPDLMILDDKGQPLDLVLHYREDYAEVAEFTFVGESEEPVYGVAFGSIPDAEGVSDPYGLSNSEARKRIILTRAENYERINWNATTGVLLVADDTYTLERRDVYPYYLAYRASFSPVMVITPELADRLLLTAGSSLAELDRLTAELGPGELAVTKPGATVHMSVLPEEAEDITKEFYLNVVGVIPGAGASSGMDNNVIIVSAYYDGLGRGPDGTLYSSANDNASGVAAMLEMARILKSSPYPPDKTVLFVAWAGGERSEGMSVVNILNARPGANELTVEAVIELSGMGYGSGDVVAIGEDSSYRLMKLFQTAAQRLGIETTTRGRSPHYGRDIRPAFGGRQALTLAVGWDGADHLAHTAKDRPDIIDAYKLASSSRPALLSLFIISRETEY